MIHGEAALTPPERTIRPPKCGRSKFFPLTICDIENAILKKEAAGRVISVCGPVHRGLCSSVYSGIGDIYPGRVAIKLHFDRKTGLPDGNAASADFNALKRLSILARSGNSFAVAAPFDIFEDIGGVVSEWLDGPSMAKALRWSRKRYAERMAVAAGAWLGSFHRSSLEPAQPLNAVARLGTVEMNSLAGLSSLPAREALDRLEATAAHVAFETAPWARLHGDFKPENLIVVNGKMTAIDFGPAYNGSVINDIAQFLNNMDLLLRTPLCFHLERRRLTREFLSGYEMACGISLSRKLVAWERLVNALRLAVSHRRWSRPPCRWMVGWQLHHMISHLIVELERNSEQANAKTC